MVETFLNLYPHKISHAMRKAGINKNGAVINEKLNE